MCIRDRAADGREALEVFSSEPDIDLIILDVMMPVYDGWSVCREIRKTSQVPIIMLTARGEESDELFGFDLGADEYISKPFSLKILAARVHALLRRTENTKEIKSFGDLVIDKPGRQVYLAGEDVYKRQNIISPVPLFIRFLHSYLKYLTPHYRESNLTIKFSGSDQL